LESIAKRVAESRSKGVAKTQAAAKEPTFEESLQELERIVDELEAGELGLGDALDAYELGIKHLKVCHKLLEGAERRIELLSGVDANGNAISEPFEEHLSDDLTEQASSRGRKRTSGRTSRDATDSVDSANVDDPRALF
jgi:exodeoxyribonuclease VII small subunit